MGIKGAKTELETIMNDKDSNAIDFAATVREMGSVNPKIKLMIQLRKGFK